jgi:hypothetical protein
MFFPIITYFGLLRLFAVTHIHFPSLSLRQVNTWQTQERHHPPPTNRRVRSRKPAGRAFTKVLRHYGNDCSTSVLFSRSGIIHHNRGPVKPGCGTASRVAFTSRKWYRCFKGSLAEVFIPLSRFVPRDVGDGDLVAAFLPRRCPSLKCAIFPISESMDFILISGSEVAEPTVART